MMAGRAGRVKLALVLAAACALAGSMAGAQAADPASRYREARALMAQGEIYRAVDALMAATAANPAYADAWAALAQCHYELGEYERSLEFSALAGRYGPRSPELLDLEGFCQLALGRLDDARSSFSASLAKLPGDRDARFGLALLDIRSGRTADAKARLSESLRLSPRDPRALLSMALIARAENRAGEAATYLAEALRWNSGDADVSYMAAVMAAESGALAEAARLCRLALEAKPGHAAARGLLASLYYDSGALSEARLMLEQALKLDRKDSQAWYLSGLVEAAAGHFSDAEYALSQLASLRPDDEIARLAVEHLVMDMTGLEDPVRAHYAAWRLSRAAELERQLLYERALAEYRRALAIDPYSNKARLSYAKLLRMSKLYSSYFAELAFLRDLGKADRALEDALEAYASFMQDTVLVSWKADGLAVAERPWRVAVFSAGPGGLPYHAGSDLVIARHLRDLLTAQPQLEMARSVARVPDFADAYRLARESGADWFILVRVAESEREVLLSAELRSARSGALAVRIDAPRSGNDRVSLAVARLVSQLSATIPLKGSILDRRGDLALADLGKLDGLAVGEQLAVVRAGAVAVKPDASGLAWPEADVVATFTVTRLDDEVCEGTLTRTGFFDRANPRDSLVRLPQAGASPSAASPAVAASTWTTLFERVRSLY